MLRARCPYCGRPFSVSREEAAGILARALTESARYGMRECPFCRRRVKIGLAELRRVAPAGAELVSPVPEAAASPSPEPPAGTEAPTPEPEEEVPPAPTPQVRRERTEAAPSGPKRSRR
ncbi:MAG: hypothetical protein J7452_01510 [Thermoflexus sp.]|jgi:outer membrane biosynthesis protein TonB|nr:hypothetical protein [Thermoflexus sp.]